MFLHVSVIHSVHGRSVPDQVPLPPEQTPPRSRPPSRTRYTPQDQVHPLGPGTPPLEQNPPEQSMLGDTVNVRAVRILLECNLVKMYYSLVEGLNHIFIFTPILAFLIDFSFTVQK